MITNTLKNILLAVVAAAYVVYCYAAYTCNDKMAEVCCCSNTDEMKLLIGAVWMVGTLAFTVLVISIFFLSNIDKEAPIQ